MFYYVGNYALYFTWRDTDNYDEGKNEEQFKPYKVGGNAFYQAKLAASNCCVALSKAHLLCSSTYRWLFSTESAYGWGSVQMLFDVPHHIEGDEQVPSKL